MFMPPSVDKGIRNTKVSSHTDGRLVLSSNPESQYIRMLHMEPTATGAVPSEQMDRLHGIPRRVLALALQELALQALGTRVPKTA